MTKDGVEDVDTTAKIHEYRDVDEEKSKITQVGNKVRVEVVKSNDSSTTDVEITKRRLWFVRMPKPPEATLIRVLEQEVETYQAQVRLLNETLSVHKLERDAAREQVRIAREAFRRCKEAFDIKNAEIKPLRDVLQLGGQASRKIKEDFADLGVRSETELDAKIAAANHRIERESIPLNEEKKLVAEIKKLESQRARVKEFESTIGSVAEVRAEIERVKGEIQEHDSELSVLKREKDTQQVILNKFREQEAEADAKVDASIAERKRLKELQDAAYSRMSEARRIHRSKNDEYYANRRFSRAVREVLSAGNFDQAQDMCSKQIQEAHSKLFSDVSYMKEYVAQWEHLRKIRVEEEDELAVLDYQSHSKSASPSPDHHHTEYDVIEPEIKAQAVIAAALEQAGITPQPDKLKENEESPAPKGPPKQDIKKPKAPSLYPSDPIVEVNDKFTLPEIVLQKFNEGISGNDKQAEKERNRQLQAESEARKLKRDAEKAKRKAKAALLAAEQEQQARNKAKSNALVQETSEVESNIKSVRSRRHDVMLIDSEVEDSGEDTFAKSSASDQMAKKNKKKSLHMTSSAIAKGPIRRARNWRRGVFKALADKWEDLSDSENSLWVVILVLSLALVLFKYLS